MLPFRVTGSPTSPSVPLHSNAGQYAAAFDSHLGTQQMNPSYVTSSNLQIASNKLATSAKEYMNSYAQMLEEASRPLHTNNFTFRGETDTISANTAKIHLTNEKHYIEAVKTFADDIIGTNKGPNERYASIQNDALQYDRSKLLLELENLSLDLGKILRTSHSQEAIEKSAQATAEGARNFPSDPIQIKMLAIRNIENLTGSKQKSQVLHNKVMTTIQKIDKINFQLDERRIALQALNQQEQPFSLDLDNNLAFNFSDFIHDNPAAHSLPSNPEHAPIPPNTDNLPFSL